MQSIKLWSINDTEEGPAVQAVDIIDHTNTEEKLEDVLVKSPDLLMDGLTLIGRQTSTAGGPLDLLGVDSDGKLVIFELKRGVLTRDAVAQIIDYASDLNEMDNELLCRHISDRSGTLGIDAIEDFRDWYQEKFHRDVREVGKPRMVLVGLGVDDRARRMVEFLSDSDLDVSLITFHAFQRDGQLMLARQIEVESQIEAKVSSTYSKKTNLQALQQLVKELKIDDFYFDISAFLRSEFDVAYEWPNRSAFSYSLTEQNDKGTSSSLTYLTLSCGNYPEGLIDLYLHPRAINAAGDGFKKLCEELALKNALHENGLFNIWLRNAEDWTKLQPWLSKLLPLIIDGWKAKREAQAKADIENAAIETSDNKD